MFSNATNIIWSGKLVVLKVQCDQTDLVRPINSVFKISDLLFLEFSRSMSIKDTYEYINYSDSDDDILLSMMLEQDNTQLFVHSRNQRNFYNSLSDKDRRLCCQYIPQECLHDPLKSTLPPCTMGNMIRHSLWLLGQIMLLSSLFQRDSLLSTKISLLMIKMEILDPRKGLVGCVLLINILSFPCPYMYQDKRTQFYTWYVLWCNKMYLIHLSQFCTHISSAGSEGRRAIECEDAC